MDDFGTGYSSLSYLYRLPVNYLKIDRSFINQITEDSPSQSIVKTIITLGDLLDIQTVAEGVETNDQLNLLKKMGCGLGQGYFWSKPMAVREIDCFLDWYCLSKK
ncbi:EAL domain-containing protein [Synechocystis sp. B12]|nr:EAL domain-containing protein [Synechocystis sp. B12]